MSDSNANGNENGNVNESGSIWSRPWVRYVALIAVLIIVGSIYLRFELPVVSVAAEHIPGWGFITNALLTSWIATILIIVVAFLGTRNMELVPSGLQNVLELIIEQLYNLVESVAGPKWAPKFYMIPVTIFIYVLVSNWMGLLPGLAGIGKCAPNHHGHGDAHAEVAHVEDADHGEADTHAEDADAGHDKDADAHAEDADASHGEDADAHHVEEGDHSEEASSGFMLGTTCGEDEHIVPFFRSPSADLNNTFSLALITQIAAQVFGVMALGAAGYTSKFFIYEDFMNAFQPDADGNQKSLGATIGEAALGLINLFVGLLELLSEFIKVIAFTFRLFGNIFAGEVMLIVLTFLVPLVLTIPFLGFEIFVGLVQAFIFFILSVAFYSVAVTSHDHDHEEGDHH